MQHTTLSAGDTTCRTGNGGYLFGREFALFHSGRMRHHASVRRSLLNTFRISHYQLGKSGISPYGVKANLVVQDNTQKRGVNVESAVVLDESQFSEFVHEEIHAGARCANHFC